MLLQVANGGAANKEATSAPPVEKRVMFRIDGMVMETRDKEAAPRELQNGGAVGGADPPATGSQTRARAGPQLSQDRSRIVLDLDNTLVHVERPRRMPTAPFQRLAMEEPLSLLEIWRDRRGALRELLYSSYHLLIFGAATPTTTGSPSSSSSGSTRQEGYMTLRPFLFEFLSQLAEHHDIFVYSNGAGSYVRAALVMLVGDLANPACIIKGVFTRDEDPEQTKCLGRLAVHFAEEYEAWQSVYAVDDQPKLWYQLDRVVTVPPFFAAKSVESLRARSEWEAKGRFLMNVVEQVRVMREHGKARRAPPPEQWWHRANILRGVRVLIYHKPSGDAAAQAEQQKWFDVIFRCVPAHGGEVSSSFDDANITHFVVCGTDTQYCLEQPTDASWHHVSFDWVRDSLCIGQRLDESLYALDRPQVEVIPAPWRDAVTRMVNQCAHHILAHRDQARAAASRKRASLTVVITAVLAVTAGLSRRVTRHRRVVRSAALQCAYSSACIAAVAAAIAPRGSRDANATAAAVAAALATVRAYTCGVVEAPAHAYACADTGDVLDAASPRVRGEKHNMVPSRLALCAPASERTMGGSNDDGGDADVLRGEKLVFTTPYVLPSGETFLPLPLARAGWEGVGAAQGRCQMIYTFAGHTAPVAVAQAGPGGAQDLCTLRTHPTGWVAGTGDGRSIAVVQGVVFASAGRYRAARRVGAVWPIACGPPAVRCHERRPACMKRPRDVESEAAEAAWAGDRRKARRVLANPAP